MNIYAANLISGSPTGPFTGSITNIFSRGGTVVDETNFITTNQVFTVWRAPYQCRLAAIYCRASGAIGAQVNARISGSSGYLYHTGSNIILDGTEIWKSANTVDNVSYGVGDTLQFIISGSSNVSSVSVQADFGRI